MSCLYKPSKKVISVFIFIIRKFYIQSNPYLVGNRLIIFLLKEHAEREVYHLTICRNLLLVWRLTAPSFPCWGEGNTILSGLNLNNASKTSHPTKYIYHYTLKCDSFFSRSIIYVFNLLTAIIPHFFFFIIIFTILLSTIHCLVSTYLLLYSSLNVAACLCGYWIILYLFKTFFQFVHIALNSNIVRDNWLPVTQFGTIHKFTSVYSLFCYLNHQAKLLIWTFCYSLLSSQLTSAICCTITLHALAATYCCF